MAGEAAFLGTEKELSEWAGLYKAIAMTNGCFDLLHAGHVEYLSAASEKAHGLGMPFLVAVNSDESVSRLKGPGRPVNKMADRVKVLCALRCVDAVTWFDQDTPEQLVKKVRPMLLIKAGDYKGKRVVGADFVRSIGGETWLAPYRDGISTSEILRIGGANVEGAQRPKGSRKQR